MSSNHRFRYLSHPAHIGVITLDESYYRQIDSTAERELVGPVALCSDNGRRLNPAACGWSRRPLHRANLKGLWGRTKRWDYWAIQSADLVVSITLADIDYVGLANVEWIDPGSHMSGGRSVTVPLARDIELPEMACSGDLSYRSDKLEIGIGYDTAATTLRADWVEPDGSNGSLRVEVANPVAHESLNVVIPWSDRRFQFTSKHQGRRAIGRADVGGRTVELGGGSGDAWGILDVGRGRWPYRTNWNWGGGAGTSDDGRRVALQFGAKWTSGTGYTENGVFVDGRLHKIGEELTWTYRWDDPLGPWRVRSEDGDLDVVLTPVHDRHARTNLGVITNEVHQVFGTWSGSVPDGTGSTLVISDALGFAEESRARW